MFRINRQLLFLCLGLAVVLLATYGNHFQNSFHFDDFHTVTGNPFIRDLHNIPRFFRDATLFSTLPDHATWRPVVSASLAADYRMGKGLTPFYFHLSTFFWFVLLVILTWFLFWRIMDLADPHPSNSWAALGAAACFGLHPVMAETVNYVIQRADLYCTLGVVAGLYWFVARPAQRRWGWYLLPFLAACLSKPTALVFPAILLTYLLLFENNGDRNWKGNLLAALPAVVATIAVGVVTVLMTPATYVGGAASRSLYRLTQPWIALHYFKSFFLPTELSADSDWTYISDPLGTDAVIGYAFVMALVIAAWRTWRIPEARPAAFGIVWFLVALLPTSLMPLAEVTNDHRMFFPFVGLALAVFWGLRLLLFRQTERLTTHGPLVRGSILALLAVLAAEAAGTHARNAVWLTEETLWQEVTVKSPKNGRGLMNYGLIFMQRGDYRTALRYFERALPFTPNYWALEVNLGLANSGLQSDVEAERHFVLATQFAPSIVDPYFYYGRWLQSKGRTAEAESRLAMALQIDPRHLDTRHVLMQLYTSQRNWTALDRLADDTLRLDPGDEVARQMVSNRSTRNASPAAAPGPTANAADAFLDLSLREYQAGRFDASIAAAKKALAFRPDYAEAYNNMAAAYNSMGKYDDGIEAALQAIRLKPDFQLAKNNMMWAVNAKKQAGSK